MLKLERKRNRRRRDRQLLNTSVQLFIGTAQVNGLGINVSDVGMCLFTLAHLAVDSHVQLEFLPPNSKEPVRVGGIIRHRALYLYGIEFLEEAIAGPARSTETADMQSAATP